MKEWIIGITDSPPSTWKSLPPIWEDEKIVATSKDSYHQLMAKLCETAIASRRERDGDSGINAHLWKLTIKSYKEMVDPTPEFQKMILRDNAMRERGDDDDSSEEESDEDDEEAYRGTFLIRCPEDSRLEDIYDPDEPQVIKSNSVLDDAVFPIGSVMTVHYDYGSSTVLYLKVLSIKSKAVRSLLQYFSLEAAPAYYIEKMKEVPAYNLPKDKQIDHYYPHFSRAFLGFHIPIFKTKTKDGQDDRSYLNDSKKAISSAVLGQVCCVRSEDDITVCSMEDRTGSSDLLIIPGKFEVNELLETGEKAWEPIDPKDDTNNLHETRYDSIMRWGISPGDHNTYATVSKMRDEQKQQAWGSKMIVFQLEKEREKRSEFQFEKVFPKTYGMLQCGKFRWFQYKKGVLRVIVGRGVGDDHRGYERDQILASWKYNFESFHGLLCAVEASWMWRGKQMTAKTIIRKFDRDKGPSNPMPKEAELVASEKDTVILSSCQDKKKVVTAMAISEDPNGKPVLYSGHDDGTLTKWNLQSNEEMWSRRIYTENMDVFPERRSSFFHIQETPGVAGLAVRPDPSDHKRHLLYTWTNGESYNKPTTLKVWSGADGEFVREHVCAVGNDEDGQAAYPTISTVVFCSLLVEDQFVDSVLVGLHCICNVFNYDEEYINFDLEEAQEHSEGNILPFYEHPNDGKGSMESWRGHFGMIRAMAVIEDKFLFSFSICPGHGRPEAMILWDLQEPGVPLFRLDLWNPYKRMFKQSATRLYGVCGISVCGHDVLFVDEYGNRVAVVKVDADDESFVLQGYAQTGPVGEARGDSFHGRMAMAGKFAAVASESESTVWIFEIEGSGNHRKLDRRDGDRSHFNDSESGPDKWIGREMAYAQVHIPTFGGNTPSSKRQKRDGNSSWCSRRHEDFGNGGPIAVALRGRNLTTAFSNGTIAKTTLPENFEDGPMWDRPVCVSANHIASCSALSSDEWHHPMLEYEEE